MVKTRKTNSKNLFKQVELLVLDVDGVLTKGEIIYDDKGRELKVFNVKDGLGIFLLRILGIKTIFLSARNSPVLRRRAKDMKVEEVIGGILPKESMISDIKSKYKIKDKNICFIGDDLIDMGMIKKVGLGIAVADAPPVVKRGAKYITKKKGGEGAVREVVDLIIKAKGLEEKVFKFLKNPK